jgi:vanillate/3-O-methylgallate O-demethylase
MNAPTPPKSLQEALDEAGNPVALLRSSSLGPFTIPGIPAEFTNWREEVRAWRNGVALLEQSYHMAELALRGTEVIPFLKTIAINKLDSFPVLRAKQIVLAGPDGNLIGDAVIFHEEDDFYRVVGAPAASDWIQFNAERSDFDVTATKNDNWVVRQAPRDVYRFQIQGVHALDLVTEVAGGTLPEVKFFHVAELTIAGKRVRALRHGMAGTPGFELYGPWDEQGPVRAAFEAAGQKYGLRKVGAMAYPTNAQESSWMPHPLPAIYTHPELKAYREWMPSYYLEAAASLAGSFVSDRIEDYYVDPIEVGYGNLVDWDGDFVGKEALREKADNPTRTKVTLVWNDEDLAELISSSLFGGEERAQFVALPIPIYGTYQVDAVLKDGEPVGIAQWSSFSANAGHMISTALVDLDQATPGTELTLLWGEHDSPRATVSTHVVREVRVTVAPAPYFDKVIKTAS